MNEYEAFFSFLRNEKSKNASCRISINARTGEISGKISQYYGINLKQFFITSALWHDFRYVIPTCFPQQLISPGRTEEVQPA